MVYLCKLLALASLQNLVGASLIQNGQFTQPLDPSWSHRPADSALVPNTSVSGTTAEPGDVLQLRFGNPPHGNIYDITMGQRLDGSIKKGDTVHFQIAMRSDDSSTIGMVVETHGSELKVTQSTFVLGTDWHEYQTAFTAPKDYSKDELQITFYLGYGAGSAQMANMQLEDVGDTPVADLHIPVDYYGNQPNPDTWKAAADARIQQYREGAVKINVTDASGAPVPNATVKVVQQRHMFHFGTAVREDLINGTTYDDGQYRDVLKTMFNTAVFEGDMNWYSIDKPDYYQTDKAVDWLKSNGFDIRGHALVWGGWSHLPKELRYMSKNAAINAIHNRIKEAMSHYKGKVYTWDVVNEPIGQDTLWEKVGSDQIAQVYKWAKEEDPSVQLAINDYDITEEISAGPDYRKKVEALVQKVKAAGGQIDVLGMQSHVNIPMTTASRVLGILDELDKLGVKLEVTEYDLGVEDDTVHSQYTQDYMQALFSHPCVQGFTIWGFWAGAQWRAAQGGEIVHEDWSERPTAKAMMNLIHNVWWTNASLTSDDSGSCSLRAFYGTQRITVTAKGESKTMDVNVSPGAANTFTVAIP